MIRRLVCRLLGCRPVRADYSPLHDVWFTSTRCPRCRRQYSFDEQIAAVPNGGRNRIGPIGGDFKLGGEWGNHISLLKPGEMHLIDLNEQTVPVVGHCLPRPKVGQTLVGEFRKSFIKFRFESVDYCRDPADMFFAEVRAVERIMKDPK